MGRKTERITALERRLARARGVIEHLVDAVGELGGADEDAARRAQAWLDYDPRPASDEGQLHWLHIKDGDRLVWRLAAELVALHDAEATRLGRPTLKHHRPPRVVAYDPALVDALHRLERDHGLLAIRDAIDAIWPAGTIRPCPTEESP